MNLQEQTGMQSQTQMPKHMQLPQGRPNRLQRFRRASRPVVALMGALLLILTLGSQTPEKPKEGAKKPTPTETPAKKSPAVKLNPLEQKFVEDLTNSTLVGKWRLVKDGTLGEEREEKYNIRAVKKVGGDFWIISARVRYGKRDVTLPVPVKVYWGGDTPIISITNVGLPGLGTYTARVMIYGGYYTGTWSGPGHGGFLTGTIVKEES